MVWGLSGSTNTCSFTVTVLSVDDTPPIITCQSNIVVYTCGTNVPVNYTVTATDNSGMVIFTNCTPPSGSGFPLGTNTVICTATNGAGTVVDTCSFKVVVLSSPCANGYDFLPVTITGGGGKFTSPNGNGFITVTNTGRPFRGLNNTPWTSQFPTLFPGIPTAPGWLAQADNFASYTNTFYLNNYYLSNTTAFGIWSITEEANTYRIQLFDGAGTQIAPVFTWNFLGYDDDALAGNISWYHMVLNPATGFFAPTPYKGFGTDCDAAFWDNLPLNTKKIVVTGNLGAANADGVVFYFAERRRCPTILCPSCDVDLSVAFAGGSIVISWLTASGTGFTLEEADQLVGPAPNWTTFTNTPTPGGENSQVVLPANRPRKFYRLHQTQP